MNREDQLKSLKREHPDRIPVRANCLPSAWMKYREDLEEIVRKYPLVFGEASEARDYDRVHRESYRHGEYADAWGCVWSNIKDGMEAIVTGHPAPSREDVRSLEIPRENDNMPHGFMFLRLADIRGFEELMMDFAEEPPELQMLIDKVLEYNLRQVRLKIEANPGPERIVYFGDDLGMQQSLPVHPEKWRRYLKPCFARIYEPVNEAKQYVYMHTDGHILEIIPDLVECGVSVLNPQVGANGLENLRDRCKGKVCVDLDLNRQMFPFWKPDDIDAHIQEAIEVLGSPEGGLWLKAEIADDVPLENIEAVAASLEKHSTFYN